MLVRFKVCSLKTKFIKLKTLVRLLITIWRFLGIFYFLKEVNWTLYYLWVMHLLTFYSNELSLCSCNQQRQQIKINENWKTRKKHGSCYTYKCVVKQRLTSRIITFMIRLWTRKDCRLVYNRWCGSWLLYKASLYRGQSLILNYDSCD